MPILFNPSNWQNPIKTPVEYGAGMNAVLVGLRIIGVLEKLLPPK